MVTHMTGKWLTHVAHLLANGLKQLVWADPLGNEGAKDLVKVLGVHPRHSCGPHTAEAHKLCIGDCSAAPSGH